MVSAVEQFQAKQRALLSRYGVDAQSRFLEVPSVHGPVHVLTQERGPPVVLVPGFADPAAMWAPLMARLDGFTRYAVDRPCFGLSGSAEHSTEHMRVLAVSFLEEVLDALQIDRALLIGNSIGSLWSFWLALDHPDRVAAMVHVGCPAFLLNTSAPLPMRLLSIPPLGRLLMRMTPPSAAHVERFSRMVGEDLSRAPELRDLLVAAQRLPGAQAAIRELLHALVRLRGARPEVALTADQIAQVRQPVLLIWGEQDPFGSPDVGEEAAGIIPDADFRLVAGAGHAPWIAHPTQVSAGAIPFLRAHLSTALW